MKFSKGEAGIDDWSSIDFALLPISSMLHKLFSNLIYVVFRV